MRKSYLFLFILSLVTLLYTFGHSDTYASCGGSWHSTSCPTSPYDCTGPKCGLEQGKKAIEDALGNQITKK